MNGMKSQDLVVLLKLISLQEQERQPQGALQSDDPYSVRNLESLLGISKTEINASIKRSLSSGLAIKDRDTGRPNPNRRNPPSPPQPITRFVSSPQRGYWKSPVFEAHGPTVDLAQSSENSEIVVAPEQPDRE